MATTKKSQFKINNGTDWDTYHFETDSTQVKHKKSDGTETTVENVLNSAFEVKILKDIGQKTKSIASGSPVETDTYTIEENGIYYFCYACTATAKPDGKYFIAYMMKNGGWTPIEIGGNFSTLRVSASCILSCNKGDVIKTMIEHNSGSVLNVNYRFEIVKLMTTK